MLHQPEELYFVRVCAETLARTPWRAVFRDFSACAHAPVAFFCDNLMVNNEKRGAPPSQQCIGLILARSVHGAFKVNLIYRLGGNQGRRSGSFVSERKIRHGPLEKTLAREEGRWFSTSESNT